MASPPYRSPAGSPPQPPHSILPGTTARKRPQLSAPYPQPAKRRKASTYSAASGRGHPLRQASFPPEEAPDGSSRVLRSPSVESDHTAVTAATGRKSKGGRRRKTEGSVKSGSRVASRAKSTADAGDEDEEGEDGEDDAGADADGMVDEGGKVDRLAESKKMAVLIDAFSADQAERYDTYRRIKLKKETLRRIVNQTLSQSVPPSVILTINGFTKVFIGTLVERALDVQAQNAKAATTAALPAALPAVLPTLPSPPSSQLQLEQQQKQQQQQQESPARRASASAAKTDISQEISTDLAAPAAAVASPAASPAAASTSPATTTTANPPPTNTASTSPLSPLPPLLTPQSAHAAPISTSWPTASLSSPSAQFSTPPASREATPALGPLEPNHLREALRRYRRDGEGGGAGVEGFSVGLGIPGSRAARLGGKRLFR